jgi:hypothetical protein
MEISEGIDKHSTKTIISGIIYIAVAVVLALMARKTDKGEN